jgi:hypothetical protein
LRFAAKDPIQVVKIEPDIDSLDISIAGGLVTALTAKPTFS